MRLRFSRWRLIFGALGVALVLVFYGQACNMLKRPVAKSILGSGFAHTGITSGCASCHDTGRPFAAFPLSGHPARNGQDCSACHTVTAWIQGGVSHSPVPAACASCHGLGGTFQNDMPSVLTNEMLHAHPGLPDCVTCHTSVPANVGITWAGGVFSHSPVPSTCQDCHGSQRPTTLVGNPSFDHSINGKGDCVSCHAGSAGVTWVTSTFNHSPVPTSCGTCHSSALPGSLVNEMLHSHPGIGDCVGCHTSVPANIGVTWAGGVYSHSPSPTTCQDCHSAQRPVGPVGSPVAFDHSTSGGTGDCVNCHTSPGVTWAGGAFSHSPVPTSCASCHSREVPSGTVPDTRKGFNHASAYGTECYSCHTVATANIGVTWKAGFFGHNGNNANSFQNCSPCHDTYHHNAGTNCADCHRITWPSPNSSGVYSGSFGGQ